MKWSSAQTPARDGFHDAAIVEFTSKSSIIEVFVRELVQNSLDASSSDSDPVHIIFESGQVEVKYIPDWNRLKSIFNNSKIYNSKAWPGAFEIMSKCFDSRSIKYLQLTDYNTVGLSKEQRENEVSSWEACVLADSQSVKASNSSRGSFGIGKNAAFALSDINTVLYDTVSNDGCYFGGVSKLGGHSENGVNYASKKIIEGTGGETIFKHPSNKRGLTQTILGISKKNQENIEVLLELYLYKHYLISFFAKKLKVEIKSRDELDNKYTLEINNNISNVEFLSTIRRRLEKIRPNLKLKSQKLDLEHIEQVVSALSKEMPLVGLYDTIRENKVFMDYLGIEAVPYSWKKFFENTKLNYYPDTNKAQNTIYHYRNGMFIFSKSFSNSFHVPVSIIHNVSEKLSHLYSNFETFSHDKWLKNLLKERLSEKDEIGVHQELFDFQRLIPKFFLIKIAGSKISEGNSRTEILVNNILTGNSENLNESTDGGVFGPPIKGELVKTALLINGVEQKHRKSGDRRGPSFGGQEGSKSGGSSGLGSTPKSNQKINRPLISNRVVKGETTYNFQFLNLLKGNYILFRQGLIHRAELNFKKFNSQLGSIEFSQEVEEIFISVGASGEAKFEVTVGDTLLTQWKITKK